MARQHGSPAGRPEPARESPRRPAESGGTLVLALLTLRVLRMPAATAVATSIEEEQR